MKACTLFFCVDIMLLYCQETTVTVHITFICNRRPQISCDLLYCGGWSGTEPTLFLKYVCKNKFIWICYKVLMFSSTFRYSRTQSYKIASNKHYIFPIKMHQGNKNLNLDETDQPLGHENWKHLKGLNKSLRWTNKNKFSCCLYPGTNHSEPMDN